LYDIIIIIIIIIIYQGLVYGVEVWALNTQQANKLRAAELDFIEDA
jgi:hypothetical protein